MASSAAKTLVLKPNISFYVGVLVLILSALTPLFIPLVLTLEISPALKGVISMVLLLGGPEVLGLIAIVLIGKENLLYLIDRIKTFCHWNKPPKLIGRWRYNVGLVMFFLPVLLAIIGNQFEYVRHFYESSHAIVSIVTNAIFLSSLFILGGNFWDKFRSLFVHDARAVFSSRDKEFRLFDEEKKV